MKTKTVKKMQAFVITRDRVSYTRRCVAGMVDAGLQVIVVDHGSTYEPMVEWLSSPPPGVEVVRMPNQHPRDLWTPGNILERFVESGARFVVTDCDVVPDRSCPQDWPYVLGSLLDRVPSARKAGLGLRTDDLPDHYVHAARVRDWERKYQAVDDGGLVDFMPSDRSAVVADIDTTLAMYRFYEPFVIGTALRTRIPYMACHLPWYENTANPTDEDRYYQEHSDYGHWRDPENPADDYLLNLTGA